MGLFDRFRRKPSPPDDGDHGDDGDLDEPRMSHYVLAHVALRQLALADPLAFLGILASGRRDEFLAAVRAQVEKDVGGRLPDGPLAVTPTRVGAYPCAIVALPPPIATTEAHLVALVALGDPSDPDAAHDEVAGRYFTLERGFDLGGGDRTVLCEWTAEGQHHNYGTGPGPTASAFAAALGRLVEEGRGAGPG